MCEADKRTKRIKALSPGSVVCRQAIARRKKEDTPMTEMPSRDITGKCEGECRDRVFEGEQERQAKIDSEGIQYNTPAPNSPSWTLKRNDPPGVLGGRV
jgi:hypothetical protein